MKIIIDAMGGDNAPLAPVMGAFQAAKDFGAQIVLVGQGEAILKAQEEERARREAEAQAAVPSPPGVPPR